MATRKKTIRFAANSIDIVNDTLTAFAQFTAYIPETTRTITNAWVKVGFQDKITITGGSIARWQVDFSVGGATAQSIGTSYAIGNTGESISGIFGPLDVTAHIASNFGAGGSNTVDISLLVNQSTGTTLGMVNCTAELFVTYEYDDTAATQIKTVVIPLESHTTSRPTTATELGTDQIPQLTGAGGILPENGVSIRSYYFMIEGNTMIGTSTTDCVMNARIDAAGASITFSPTENALASNRWNEFIWNLTASVPTTTDVHKLYLWTTGLASYHHCSVKLVITYEFTVSGTTRVLNSIQIPFEIHSPSGSPDAASNSRLNRDFFIEEPNVSLVQSGFQVHYAETAKIPGLNIRAGSQAYREYTESASVLAGMVSVTQRIDSGAAQGVGITFARGKNTLTVDIYDTSAAVFMSNIGGLAYINYLSDVSASGIGAHNHTVYEVKSEFQSLAVSLRKETGVSVQIPESQYYVNAIGTWTMLIQAGSGGIFIAVNRGSGLGWDDVYASFLMSDYELGQVYVFSGARDVFKVYPEDPVGISLETSRDFFLNYTVASRFGFCVMCTYHSIVKTVAGTVSGFTGDGSGMTVYLIDEATGTVLNSATTTTGGAFSMSWYDDVQPVYCATKQGVDRAGRSLSGVGA